MTTITLAPIRADGSNYERQRHVRGRRALICTLAAGSGQ
jgi:hypothetical protein